MQAKIAVIILLATLGFGFSHYMAYAEEKCLELGNTPQQCAALSE